MSVVEEVREDHQFIEVNEIDVHIRPTERRHHLDAEHHLRLEVEDFAYEESLSKEHRALEPPSQEFTEYVTKNPKLSDASYYAARNNFAAFTTYTPQQLALLDDEDRSMLQYYSNQSARHKPGLVPRLSSTILWRSNTFQDNMLRGLPAGVELGFSGLYKRGLFRC